MQTFIRTFSGKKFDYANPQEDQIDILDIAHALSQLCRFSGQSPCFYSVAQHCVYASQLAELEFPGATELQLAALLHDACEAYINDVPLPLKQFIPAYGVIEDDITNLIFQKYGICLTYQAIKKYDAQALSGEFADIIRTGWVAAPGEFPMLMPGPALSPKEAEAAFLGRFIQLKGIK